MASQGVFRDDFYNAISVLPSAQATAYTAGTGVLPASALAGAGDAFLVLSGQAAITGTTDSAVNIIAQLQQAVATAYKNQISGFGAGVNPPSGVPNLFNLSWAVTLNNQNSASLTTTGGAGVTISGLGGLSATTVLTATSAEYVLTVTSPTTITMVRVS